MNRGLRMMLMSVAVTAVLLLIVVGWLLVSLLSYGKEWADYEELYHLSEEDEAVVYLEGSMIPYRALRRDGQMYLAVDDVQDMLNSRFYVDEQDVLFYTLPNETVEVAPGQRTFTIAGETMQTDWAVCVVREGRLYVSVEYVALFTDMQWWAFDDPGRLLISRGSGEETWATVEKKAQIRYQAGRKSPILTESVRGDQVCILGAEGDWMKVRSADGFIGYIPAKVLSESSVRTVENESIPQDYTGTRVEGPIRLAWHQVFVTEANVSLREFLDEAPGVTVISPTWFALTDSSGGFSSLAEQWYVDEAHARGIQVWGLVNDFSDSVDKYALLSDTESRRSLIANLVSAALEYDLDGINIDFEKISSDTGEHFIQFIRELSVECRREGLVLSVDNYSPVGGWSWYHLQEQGIVADYVIMMGYDEHWAGGTPGSTASISFTETTLEMALEKVPADKLIHGIPFYTRVWGEKAGVNVSSTAVSMVTAKNRLDENGADVQWLDREGQYFGQYVSEGILYSIWLEDLTSLELKLKAIKKAGVAGVACWKLGLEDPAVWPVISEYFK